MKIKDKFGKIFILTDERLLHIKERHLEMENKIDKISEVLSDPDIVIQNVLDKDVQLYHKFYKDTGVYIVVVVQAKKGFILTAYESYNVKKGDTVWKKD